MSKKVTIETLAEDFTEIFAKYTEDVEAIVEWEVLETAKNALADIKRDSPIRTGGYKKGWSRRKRTKDGQATHTIYNKNKPKLTHLLEWGWTSRKGNRITGQPHIEPAYKKHVETMPARIEKIIKEID